VRAGRSGESAGTLSGCVLSAALGIGQLEFPIEEREVDFL
jgi:hypothetical protein